MDWRSNAFLFSLLAMVMWGGAPLAEKAGLKDLDPLIGLTLRSLTVSGLLLAYLLVAGRASELFKVGAGPVGLIILGGIMGSMIGQFALFVALKNGEASAVAPVAAAFPLITALGAAIFLGERFGIVRISGALLIVAGVVLVRKG